MGEAGEELWFDENYGNDALVVAEEETAHGCEDGAEGDVAGGEDAAEAGFTVWLAGLGWSGWGGVEGGGGSHFF